MTELAQKLRNFAGKNSKLWNHKPKVCKLINVPIHL